MVYYGRHSKKVEKYLNKISSTGCKWSSLNHLSTETFEVIQFEENFASFRFTNWPLPPSLAACALRLTLSSTKVCPPLVYVLLVHFLH